MSSHNETPTQDQFARLVMEEAQKSGIEITLAYLPEGFALRSETSLVNLQNTYVDYCQNFADRESILRRLLSTISVAADCEPDGSFEAVRHKLVSVVRERALIALTELQAQIEAPHTAIGVAHEPMTDYYSKAVVLDHPDCMVLVTHDMLETWGVTFEDAFEAGLSQLRERTQVRFERKGGYFVGAWNDGYDSSRALLPALFDHLPLRGAPVLVMPNEATLMVAGADDNAAVSKLLDKAEKIFNRVSAPQNPAPLIIRGGKVDDWNAAESSPQYIHIQRARRLTESRDYDQQKRLLDKLHQNRGKDVLVATYFLSKRTDGSYVSHASWGKGIATLLPKTDFVGIADPSIPGAEREMVTLPWEELCSLAGGEMLDVQMFPPRYFVSRLAQHNFLRGNGTSRS
jgi:hypothetical protein